MKGGQKGQGPVSDLFVWHEKGNPLSCAKALLVTFPDNGEACQPRFTCEMPFIPSVQMCLHMSALVLLLIVV